TLGSDAKEFDVESLSGVGRKPSVFPFDDAQISRRLGAGIDEWTAGDLKVRIVSSVGTIPDPENATDLEMKLAIVPAVLVEIQVDNRKGTRPRKVFLGRTGLSRIFAMRAWTQEGLCGVSQGAATIATDDPSAYAGVGFQPEAVLDPFDKFNLNFLLGKVGLLVATAPPKAISTFRFAVSFFQDGPATAGRLSRYFYRRVFESEESVLRFALDHAEEIVRRSEAFDRTLEGLTETRRLMLAMAIRSYYGSTQLLEFEDGSPAWIVNEGEYRMMNTLDLMVDQAFFELEMNPWTVRNQLDFHRKQGSYRDSLGLTFTHDLGIANTFSEPGVSAYEQSGLRGCFSYMSGEELVNWILTAGMYGLRAKDTGWLEDNADLLAECLQSLARRDHPYPAMRDGIMSFDSDRCRGGSEITTYDSLDASLGQAKGNLYLAVKSWAACVVLSEVFDQLKMFDRAGEARMQAMLGARTLSESVNEFGILPALVGEDHPAHLIPAIEGLVFPAYLGLKDALEPNGPYGSLILALARHLHSIENAGQCRFADGGWKLSSTSRNSWLSKIYLCQAVAENLFSRIPDRNADEAHLAWLLRPENAYFAWSDQMLEGVAVGSRYYPRGVTSFLWLIHLDSINASALSNSPRAEIL
ncbi:MAG TPA: glycoside hydrolase family 52 protein, partial [Fimbriimonadaceae bacterium]|nr:glycoside hydrolase family 52 protein [Fimbriimonadaceae bacterium]